MQEVLDPHVHERGPLHVLHADGVEEDIDPARCAGHRSEVPLDGLLVVRIHLGRLGRTSRRGDLVRHRSHLRERAAGQEEARPLPGERARHRPAERPTCPVDHRALLAEEHGRPHPARPVRCTTPPSQAQGKAVSTSAIGNQFGPKSIPIVAITPAMLSTSPTTPKAMA